LYLAKIEAASRKVRGFIYDVKTGRLHRLVDLEKRSLLIGAA
jgi:hypothetical protein